MNDYSTNLKIVKEILCENLSVKDSDINPTAELVGDLGINSLELADLILMCEERFEIEVDDTKMSKFVTLDDFVNYLTAL